MDAMHCPDGSYVGRSGPKCEFVCPSGTTTESILIPTEVADPEPNIPTLRMNPPSNRRVILEDFRQQRIINLAANISNRLDATVERLFNLIGRLETRIQKLKQQGFGTAEAEVKLREASQSLAEAKSLLDDIDASVYNATTSDRPGDAWQILSERYRDIANLIRRSHASLRETVALLKVAVVTESNMGVSEAVSQETSTPAEDTAQ